MERSTTLAKNRAEEFGHDLWQDFVIPPYFVELEMLHSRKPSVIIGGRGCGKTMLLRYLCHESQFSNKRENITEDSLNKIGIYWKIDTQFAKTMTKRGENTELWSNAFIHMGVITLAQEILKSLESIRTSNIRFEIPIDLSSLDFNPLNGFDPNIPSDFINLKKYLRNSQNSFETWVSNYKKLKEPIFFPIKFIKELICIIQEQIFQLKNSDYYVYIDEYENLLHEQKRIVNTWVKHSEAPLIFNLAMKRNAFDERMTVGNEQIVKIHDYREFDIEILLDKYYDVFAAEILLLRLQKANLPLNIPISISILFEVSSDIIKSRQTEEYKRIVTNKIQKILPTYSQKELSTSIIQDLTLSKKIRSLIEEALNRRGAIHSLDKYYDEKYPEAMIVLPALLNRKSISTEDILKELSLLKKNEDNKFTGKTNWIHNNLFGCTLFIYNKLNRLCPLYSGFETFCVMSRGNIRHFLELCLKSIANINFNAESLFVSPKEQSAATKQVSTSLLKEVKALGPQGNSLYAFVIRLGTIFEYCRDNPLQSEPEQNHFDIEGNLSLEAQAFLDELVKWSVLYEEKLTKRKNEEIGVEYILNPIYSAYFNISFRKKRRITITSKDFMTIAFDDFSEYEKLLRKKYQKNTIEQKSLFDLFNGLT